MWQVLLAAAIAGSGYFVKHLVYNNDKEPTNHPSQNSDLPTEPPLSLLAETNEEASSIFRFSSACDGSKNYRKKSGNGGGVRGNRKKIGPEKKVGDGLVDDQRKSGKKFAVCLKKRRTGRNASAKCDSSDVKDKSSFGWGVGVGIMYMMSAGKAEIDRLKTAVDETAKVVQELKAENSKRKPSHDLKVGGTADQKQMDMKWGESNMEKDDASSILTEEHRGEAPEMDQLEAELEHELLKLHGSAEISSSLQNKDSSAEELCKPKDLHMEFNQGSGVMPSQLDQKLCHLLIEQQESQIVDLESELHHTNSKLLEKESELQALKDCVKRLTEFSLTCPSDEEKEGQVDEADGRMINGNGKSMVGTKRAMDFD